DAVTTNAKGQYSFATVAEGSYSLAVKPAAPVVCNGNYTGALRVDADKTADVKLPNRTDAAGTYSCAPVTYSWIKGSSKVSLTGDEDAKTISLPFPVKVYGVSYTSTSVTTNGVLNFLQPRLGDYSNVALPSASQPNGVVAPFWDDLALDGNSSVQTSTTGSKGSRTFAIVWNKAQLLDGSGDRVTFEAVFSEATGAITFQYRSVPGKGSSATVGIENQAGTDALQYSFNQNALTDLSAIRFTPKAA
ncbi:peptidase S8, partial [Streptomyces sp. NPDC051784]